MDKPNTSDFSVLELQRVADAFSVGTVLKTKKILSKTVSFRAQLTAKYLRESFLLAAVYAQKLPQWLEKNKDKTNWNFTELSEELKKIGITHHIEEHAVVFYSVKTSKNLYLAFGINPGTGLSDKQIKSVLKKELGAVFVKPIPVSYDKQLYSAHHFDFSWRLYTNIELSRSEAEAITATLKNKKIDILIGYGAPILADIGELNSKDQPEVKLFTEEYWWVEENGKRVTERWHVPKDFFESAGELFIKDVFFNHTLKRTHIVLSNNQTIVIERNEEFRTWYLDFTKQRFTLSLTGTKKFIQSDYHPPVYKHKKRKFKRKKVQDEEVYVEYVDITSEQAASLLKPLLKEKITEISPYSGKEFIFRLGEMFDEWSQICSISIDAEWTVSKDETPIASSKTHAFKYEPILNKYFLGKKLITPPNLSSFELEFSNNLKLSLLPKRRKTLSSWATFFNRRDDYHLSLYKDGWRYTGREKVLKLYS